MANVKFIKVRVGSTFPTTGIIEGAIYFDENTKQIKLGGAANAVTTYGGKVADAIYDEVAKTFTVKFSDGTKDIVLDFSDCASAAEMASRLKTIEDTLATKIDTLQAGDNVISVSKEGTTGTVGLKIATGSDAGNVALVKTRTGLAASVSVPVKGVVDGADTKATLTNTQVKVDVALTDAITVAGGPLADDIQDNWPTDAAWNVGGVKTIPAGLSLSEILAKLFTKEVEGTVSFSYSAWNPTLGAPTVTLSTTSTQEVGNEVTATWAANSSVANNNVTATGAATQGYFTSPSGSWNSGNYTQKINGTQSGDASVAATWNGVAVATSGSKVVCKEGTNTLACANSGITATMGNFTAATIYASTNTKKCISTKSAVLDVDARAGSKAITSNASKQVTAQYYGYMGYTTKTDAATFTSADIKALTAGAKKFLATSGVTTLVDATGKTSTGTSIAIAVPAVYTLSDIQNSLGVSIKANFSSVANAINYTNGTVTTKYRVYLYPITSGAQIAYKNVTVKRG